MSPHDDGAAIFKLRETPRWKCGEIYTWNNAELYAVECLLCDDKNLCTLSDFATHMKVCHRSWECCSEDSVDCKINNSSAEEQTATATIELQQSASQLMTQADNVKVAQWMDTKEQEASSAKLVVDIAGGPVKQSMVLELIVGEEKEEHEQQSGVLRNLREVAQAKVVGENVKSTNEQAVSSDEMFRLLVSEATADEAKDSPCAPLSSNLLKETTHTKIAAGQETRPHFEEVLIQHVVPVAEGAAADNNIEYKIATDVAGSSIGIDVEVNDDNEDEVATSKNNEISSKEEGNECEKAMDETMEQPPEVLLAKTPNEANHHHLQHSQSVSQPQSVLQLSFNKILYLIELYEAHPRLWTPTHEEFSETDLCRDSWQEITQKFNAACKHSYKTNELKIGISTLCQRYRAEKQRVAEELTSNNTKMLNNSIKFAHFSALQFLDDQPDAMQSRRSILQQQNFKIIEIYKRFPVLWHSANKLRQSSEARAKALDDISDALKLDNIHLSSRSVQRRLHALHKCYRKEKINYLFCLRDKRAFRTNFKHYNQMQFLQRHIPPYVCSVCQRIFEKLHEHTEHMRTSHEDLVLTEKEEFDELPQHDAMEQDVDIKEDATQMFDSNSNLMSKEQQIENQNMDQILNVEGNQNNTTDLYDSNSFKEQQDKVLMDGSDVDKFLANLLEKEPFMEIAAEIFNEANAKHEVGSLMHKIQNNESMDTSTPMLKEDTVNMDKPLSFDFSADFKYAIDEIIQQSPNVNEVESKIMPQTNAKKDVVSAYDVAYAMITPNYTPASLNSATNSISSPQHYLTSPRSFMNSPLGEQISNSPQHVFNSPPHSLHSPPPAPTATNGTTHFLSSTPHIIIAPQPTANTQQQLINPINNNMMHVINTSMNSYDNVHYTSSTPENTINIMQDTLHTPDIYFNTQQTNSLSNVLDVINITEQTTHTPQYAIITSQQAMALINEEINSVHVLKSHDDAFEMATLNTATNVNDYISTKTVNLAQNLSITQNALNIAQNSVIPSSHNVMNMSSQNALNNVMNITQHVVNIPQETINYSQQNTIDLQQFNTNNTQAKTYYVTQKIVNIPLNSLNSSNAAAQNAQTKQNNVTQQNLTLVDLTTINSRDSCTMHAQVDSSLMSQNDYSSISCESFTNQMQQNTASMEPTSSEAQVTSTVKKKKIKTDFKNLKLRLKNTLANQGSEGSFDYVSQDSHIQCEVFVEEDLNSSSQDYIPLLSVPPTTRLTEEQTHTLIHIYRQHPALWNPTNTDFNSKNMRHIAWKTITIAFNKFYKLRLQWQTIYKKLTDLVKYYRKEKERIAKRDMISKWFYYNDFVFLDEYLDITSDIHKTLQEKELNLKIIEMYKTFPQLWNTHMQEYKRRSQRNRHIATMHNCLLREGSQITLERLKRKLLDFRCCFRQEKEKRIECTKNNEAFESFYEYYQQLDFLEPHMSPFICKVCGESFKKLTEILRHYRATKHQKISKKRISHSEQSQDSDSKHICHICGTKFTMRNNLVYHLNRHTGKRTHLCKMCPKSFYNSTSLRVHERSHTKECPYVCEQCGQAFVNNSKLNQHIKRHNSSKDFTCNECGKAFYTALDRDKHAKRHLKIRDQVCPICGKAFVMGSSIYTHMELHSDVKKYVCKVCDKRFAQNSGLYRHMKKHTAANESNPSS